MNNINFSGLSPELITQVIIGSLYEKTKEDIELFPKSFYDVMISASIVARLVQYLPIGKILEEQLGFSSYSLQGVLIFLNDSLEGDNKELIFNHLAELIQKGEISSDIELHANQEFLESLETLSVLLNVHSPEREKIVKTIKYIEDNIDFVIQKFEFLA